MTKRISLALVASVVVAIVGAPIAGANPVSTQYDEPTVTQPPVTESVTPPVTEAATQPPATTEPTVTESTVTEPTVTEPTEPVTVPESKGTAASNTVNTSNATTTAPAEVTTVPSSNDLPFTGLDLGVFLMIGGVAVASGLGLRRVAARRSLDR